MVFLFVLTLRLLAFLPFAARYQHWSLILLPLSCTSRAHRPPTNLRLPQTTLARQITQLRSPSSIPSSMKCSICLAKYARLSGGNRGQAVEVAAMQLLPVVMLLSPTTFNSTKLNIQHSTQMPNHSNRPLVLLVRQPKDKDLHKRQQQRTKMKAPRSKRFHWAVKTRMMMKREVFRRRHQQQQQRRV